MNFLRRAFFGLPRQALPYTTDSLQSMMFFDEQGETTWELCECAVGNSSDGIPHHFSGLKIYLKMVSILSDYRTRRAVSNDTKINPGLNFGPRYRQKPCAKRRVLHKRLPNVKGLLYVITLSNLFQLR